MRRRASAVLALVAASATLLPGCAVIVRDKPDPIHAEKLEQLERRMDRVDQGVPK